MGNVISDSSTMTWKDRGGGVFGSSLENSLLFEDDFSSFSLGALSNLDQTTAWPYIDSENAGQIAIEAYPPDNSKKAVMIEYVNSGDIDVMAHEDLGEHRHLFFQWKEYRSAGWDAGPTKDMRWNAIGHVFDMYMVINRGISGTTTGIDLVDSIMMNIQGEPKDWVVNNTQVADDNVYIEYAFAMTLQTEYKFEVELKINTPGLSDGAIRVWVDDNLVSELSPFKMVKDGVTDLYIPSMQLGMVASNLGNSFAGESKRWITDIKISEERIG